MIEETGLVELLEERVEQLAADIRVGITPEVQPEHLSYLTGCRDAYAAVLSALQAGGTHD